MDWQQADSQDTAKSTSNTSDDMDWQQTDSQDTAKSNI